VNRGMSKLIDLTGQRFGKLVVIERDYTRKNRTYWYCKCDCGNTCSLRKDALTRENKPQRSCGCDLAKRNSDAHLKDETGNRYSKLVVIKRVENLENHKDARWLCKCDCGEYCEVSGLHLRNGNVQSCGCLRSEKGKLNGIEETPGTRYGKLTVIEKSPNSRYGHVLWICKCDCGNICEVRGANLRGDVTHSCGCLKNLGEQKIVSLLEDNNIKFKREYTFPDLFGDNALLRFDFGVLDDNDKLKYLIEYDGI
jgi:hypothetical protein